MTTKDEPRFPFRLVWLETGEVETYDDPDDILCNLEEFDSRRDRSEARITDSLGRPVHLLVRIWEDLCEFRLEKPDELDVVGHTGTASRSRDHSVGNFTLVCRVVCSLVVAGPLLYWFSMTDGDAYHFLILVLLAPLAGLILIANSVFCLFRQRSWRSISVSLIFVLIGVGGALVAWHFLPQFRMH